MGYFLDNFLRRMLENPAKLLGPYVKEGMRVMDVGCGMGFFAIQMAKMVGSGGEVVAVDVQEKMLEGLRRRAKRAGVAGRIRARGCEADRLGVDGEFDFILAGHMVHEVPDVRSFAEQIHACLKPGGRFYLLEPAMHVSARRFEEEVAAFRAAGLREVSGPKVRMGRAVVLARLRRE
jgi:ubiquinone/menaquinone biosynthesis C-methylase UbiE